MRPSVETEAGSYRKPAGRSPAGEKAQRHDLDGLAVQRNDDQHTLIVDGFWIHLTPLEYRILLPLLKAYDHPVTGDAICWEVFASRRTCADDRRIYRHIDRMRSKLAPFGLVIRAVTLHGYMLLRDTESYPSSHT